MITNPDKYMDLLGVNIDKNLQFSSHVKNIRTKVNNQINVISHFQKVVPTAVKCKLYKAFIVPYLDIVQLFGILVGLEIETNYKILTKVHLGLFLMRSLCITSSS